jgi:RHS repeat-associated protein
VKHWYAYDALPRKFTGKERDSESGLDDFEARYYSSSMGRFDLHPHPAWHRPPPAGCAAGVKFLLLHLPLYCLRRPTRHLICAI